MSAIYPGAQALDDVISGLRAARQNGRLVPFVGAGVSRPYCNSWKGFIQALGQSLDAGPDLLTAATAPDASPEEMNRVADRLTAWLRLHSPERQREFLRGALRSPQPGPQPDDFLPPQAKALVAHSWPLIITSNYDDILPLAIERRSNKRPVVLGRSPQDCVRVVRSMDTLQSPIVWYVQGHVPGVAPPTAAMPASPETDALLEEVVIGHQQYQQAINGSPAFRRAFSEVFRRRSLLFIGSGLTESYFVNLIAESLFALGPSVMAHFALFSQHEADKADLDFLKVRLGITPVVYGPSHQHLPSALERIHGLEGGSSRPVDHSYPLDHSRPLVSEIAYSLRRPMADTRKAPVATLVSLRFDPLPAPTESTTVVLSVGIDNTTNPPEPLLGSMAQGYLGENRSVWPGGASDFVAIRPENGATWLFEPADPAARGKILLAAARDTSQEIDSRSLDSISRATFTALRRIETGGQSKTAVMGVLGAGRGRIDEPAFCLAAQLAGIRDFLSTPPADGTALQRVEVRVVDLKSWSPLTDGRISAGEILTSELTRVLVRVADARGRWEEYAVSVPHTSTIEDVLDPYKISGENVCIYAYPMPVRFKHMVSRLPVFPGMIVEVRPSLDGTTAR
jgi:hypothetical protein